MGDKGDCCFICGSSSVGVDSGGGGGANDRECGISKMSEQEREAYHQQEKVVLGHSVFVIRVLFQVPPLIFLDKENAPLVDSDGVSQRMQFCQGCNDSVEKALAVYREMLEALQSFRRIQLELVEKVKKEENEDDKSRQVPRKWRKFIKSYEYGADTESFLLEDIDSTVETLCSSLRSSSMSTTRDIDIKTECEDDDFPDFPAVNDSDHYAASMLSQDDLQSGTILDGLEEKKLEANYSESEGSDESEDNDLANPEPKSNHLNAEKEMEILPIPSQLGSENEEHEWESNVDDPLGSNGSVSNEDPLSEAVSSEEEYVPKKKPAKRHKLTRTRSKQSTTKSSNTRNKAPAKKPYNCTEKDCSEVFRFKTALQKHIRLQHPKPLKTRGGQTSKPRKMMNCSEEGCSKSFQTQVDLFRHLRIIHMLKPFPCGTCNEKFLTSRQLTHHMSKDHPGSTFECTQCHKSFRTKKFLHNHVYKFHQSAPTQFKCPEEGCGKMFASKGSVRRHNQNVHQPQGQIPTNHRKRFPCPEEGCGKIYVSFDALRVHISRHKDDPQYKCPTCDSKFFSWQQMKRHEEKVHLSENGVNNAFVCELCGKRFSNTQNLQNHRKKHYKKSKQYGKDSTPAICEHCGKTYAGKYSLYLHHRIHHWDKTRSSFFCEQCEIGYPTSSRLKHHMYTKHGIGTEEDRMVFEKRELKCRCQVVGCRQKFWGDTAEERFKKHMAEYHGEDGNEKKFKCDQCPSQFSSRSKFKTHQLIHLNKETRPFKCETCGKGFANRPNLRYHQLHTHKAPRLIDRKKETKPRDFIRKNDDQNK